MSPSRRRSIWSILVALLTLSALPDRVGAAVLAQAPPLTDAQRLAAYAYEASLPLAPDLKPLADGSASESRLLARYRLVYTSTHAQRVTATFTTPRKAKAPYPAVVLLAGSGGDKDSDYVRFAAGMLSTLGFATVSIDAQYHGDRRKPGVSGDLHLVNDPVMREGWVQTVVDLRRAVDFLSSRKDVDARRIGFLGFSQGAMIGGTFLGVEPRIRAACLAVGGAGLSAWAKQLGLWKAVDAAQAEASVALVDPIYFVGRFAGRPLLLLSAKQDELIPRSATEALYSAARDPKELVWFESGHVLPPAALLVNARGFFERHLGKAQLPAGGLVDRASRHP